MTILKELKVPEEAPTGNYLFVVKLEYNGEVAVGRASFSVVREEIAIEKIIKDKTILIIILSVAGLLLFVFFFFAGRDRNSHEKRIDKIHEDMHKLNVLYHGGAISKTSYARKRKSLDNKLRMASIKSIRSSNQRQHLNKLIDFIKREI
jgi:hypothetical protein